jgi:hypothetical protein
MLIVVGVLYLILIAVDFYILKPRGLFAGRGMSADYPVRNVSFLK